jgi:hypothetical protein
MDLLPSNGEPIQIEKKSQTQKAQQADDAHGRGINRGARGCVREEQGRCAVNWASPGQWQSGGGHCSVRGGRGREEWWTGRAEWGSGGVRRGVRPDFLLKKQLRGGVWNVQGERDWCGAGPNGDANGVTLIYGVECSIGWFDGWMNVHS